MGHMQDRVCSRLCSLYPLWALANLSWKKPPPELRNTSQCGTAEPILHLQCVSLYVVWKPDQFCCPALWMQSYIENSGCLSFSGALIWLLLLFSSVSKWGESDPTSLFHGSTTAPCICEHWSRAVPFPQSVMLRAQVLELRTVLGRLPGTHLSMARLGWGTSSTGVSVLTRIV